MTFHTNTSCTLRYVIFEEELEGSGSGEGGFLSVKYDENESISGCPTSYILESILSLDMAVNYTDDVLNKCFVVAKDDLSVWKSKNLLS